MSETTEPTPAPETPVNPATEPTAPAPADTAPTPQETPPDTTADTAKTADDMRKTYTFGTPDTEPTPTNDDNTPEDPPYAVEYPADFAVDETFAGIVAPIAKDSGVDGKTFGNLTAKVVRALNDAEYANMVKTDAELKKDWGAEYNANMLTAKNTAEKLMKTSGLTEQDLSVLQSPKGMRLLYAISQMTGEQPAAGSTPASAAESSWAKDIMSNPNHPDYRDFRDPSSPRWRSLNERYNRAMAQ